MRRASIVLAACWAAAALAQETNVVAFNSAAGSEVWVSDTMERSQYYNDALMWLTFPVDTGTTNFTDFTENNRTVVSQGAGTEPARTGGYAEFDGIDDNMDVTPYQIGTNGTFMVWIYPKSAHTGYFLWCDIPGANLARIYCIAAGTAINADLYNASRAAQFQLSTTYAVSNWLHVAWTWKDNASYLYTNGIQAASDTSGTVPAYTPTAYDIGDVTTFEYHGRLDDFRHLNRALSSNEVLKVYQRGNAKGIY